MALFSLSVVRGSISQSVIFVSCVIGAMVFAPLASAQHPAARPAGPGARMAPPPIMHTPVYRAPVSASPALRAPIYAPHFATWRGDAIVVRPPRRPIRPFPPVFILYTYPFGLEPAFSRYDSCWWEGCDFLWTLSYSSIPFYEYAPPSSPPNHVAPYEPPVYGEEGEDLPELYLKDGSVLSVTDYWVADEQLHFTMIETEGAKPVEHTLPFEALDLQKTIDVNTRRGFHFMLRNEPFEQYVRDHPDAPPSK